MIGRRRVEPYPADTATIERYERFLAEVDQLTDAQLAELAERHAAVATVDAYEPAAGHAADLAYDTGRIDHHDQVVGASRGTRDVPRIAQLADGCLDVAFAILARDLLDAEQYRILTGWASAVIPGLDLDDPEVPAPVSPALPPPTEVLPDAPEPTEVLPDAPEPTEVLADLDLDALFAPQYAPATHPPHRHPTEAPGQAPAGTRDAYQAYRRVRLARLAAFCTAGLLFTAAPVLLGLGDAGAAQAAWLLMLAALTAGIVSGVRVAALRRRWAPPRRAARRGEQHPDNTRGKATR